MAEKSIEVRQRPRNVATTTDRDVMVTSGIVGWVGTVVVLRVLRRVLLLLNWFLLFLLFPFRRWNLSVLSTEGGKSGKVVMRVPAAMAGRRAREKEAAARRAMAIRRVREEDGGGEDGRSVKGFSMMRTERGDVLFTRSWSPASGQIRGLIVLMHGLNEHSGRYNRFAKQLNDCGFKVYAMDWIEKVLSENPGLPCFIFGHSTGAAIVLKAVLDPTIEACIKGVVLTSPAIHVQPSHPVVAVIAPIVSFFLPKHQFNAYRDGPPVSRDSEALKSKYSDPLVFTGSLRVRTGYEILKITSYLQKNLNKVRVPFFVLHGTADNVTDPEATKKLYHEAASSDKSIKLYQGLLHDLLFELEKDEITGDIIDWLSSRIQSRA